MTSALLAGLGLCLSLIIAPGAQNVFLLKMGIRHQHVIALAVTCFVSDIILIAAGVAGFGVMVEELPWLFDLVRWAGVVFLLGYALAAGWRAVRPKGQAIDVAPESGVDRRTGDVAASVSANGDVGEAPADGTGRSGSDAAPSGAGLDPARGLPAAARGADTATLVRPQRRTGGAAPVREPRRASAATLVPSLLMCLAITWLNPHTYLDTVLLLGSVSAGYGDDRWLFGVGAVLGSAIWFAFLTVAARFAAKWLRSPLSWRILDAAIAVVMLTLAMGLALA